jgi:hypothetical protein
VAKGIQLAEEGNLFATLPWLVKPLEQEGLSPEEEKVHRTRIACYLQHTPGRPTLRQVLFADGTVSHAAWSPDAKRVLTVSKKVVQVWDVPSGKAIAMLRHPADVMSAQFRERMPKRPGVAVRAGRPTPAAYLFGKAAITPKSSWDVPRWGR